MDWKPATSSRTPHLLRFPPPLPLSRQKLANLSGGLRNRVPTLIRRAVPIYIACVLVILFVFQARVPPSTSQSPAPLRKRDINPQKQLPGGTDEATQQEEFPRKIWQSWKTDPLNFEQRDFDTARTWTTKNPGYRYEVLTDHNDLVYVEEKFGPRGFNRPDIVELYRSVNATIIKADLLRYMVMYAEGGVYADIDVEALKPVDRFVPARYNLADIDMVIGVEVDQPEFRNHPILGPKSMSFCQWTFMCRPQLPVMLQLIENIMSWLSDMASKQRVPVSEVVLDFDAVISGTGPSAFTAAVLREMNRRARLDGGRGADEITWDVFHGMDESKLVSRILVLDVEKFAAGQGHSDSGNHNARGALVKHHYHASNWPSKHPRFQHPAYGEVERCNWDAACVAKWDADVAAYGQLSPEEREKVLEARRLEGLRQQEEARRERERAAALERLGQMEREAKLREREEEEKKKKKGMEGGGQPGGEGQQIQGMGPGASADAGAGAGFPAPAGGQAQEQGQRQMQPVPRPQGQGQTSPGPFPPPEPGPPVFSPQR